jgi:hypothetical protein
MTEQTKKTSNDLSKTLLFKYKLKTWNDFSITINWKSQLTKQLTILKIHPESKLSIIIFFRG